MDDHLETTVKPMPILSLCFVSTEYEMKEESQLPIPLSTPQQQNHSEEVAAKTRSTSGNMLAQDSKSLPHSRRIPSQSCLKRRKRNLNILDPNLHHLLLGCLVLLIGANGQGLGSSGPEVVDSDLNSILFAEKSERAFKLHSSNKHQHHISEANVDDRILGQDPQSQEQKQMGKLGQWQRLEQWSKSNLLSEEDRKEIKRMRNQLFEQEHMQQQPRERWVDLSKPSRQLQIDQESICSCSPTVYQIKIEFDNHCSIDELRGNRGIGGTLCLMGQYDFESPSPPSPPTVPSPPSPSASSSPSVISPGSAMPSRSSLGSAMPTKSSSGSATPTGPSGPAPGIGSYLPTIGENEGDTYSPTYFPTVSDATLPPVDDPFLPPVPPTPPTIPEDLPPPTAQATSPPTSSPTPMPTSQSTDISTVQSTVQSSVFETNDPFLPPGGTPAETAPPGSDPFLPPAGPSTPQDPFLPPAGPPSVETPSGAQTYSPTTPFPTISGTYSPTAEGVPTSPWPTFSPTSNPTGGVVKKRMGDAVDDTESYQPTTAFPTIGGTYQPTTAFPTFSEDGAAQTGGGWTYQPTTAFPTAAGTFEPTTAFPTSKLLLNDVSSETPPRQRGRQLKVIHVDNLDKAGAAAVLNASQESQGVTQTNRKETNQERILESLIHSENDGQSRILQDNEVELVELVSAQFLEMDSSPDMTIIHQDDQYLDISMTPDEAILSYTSISSTLDPSMSIEEQLGRVPGGVILILIGKTSSGEYVRNRLMWVYTNGCGMGSSQPVRVGQEFGWAQFHQLEPPRQEFCPNAPTKPPSSSSTPTNFPTIYGATPNPTQPSSSKQPTRKPTRRPSRPSSGDVPLFSMDYNSRDVLSQLDLDSSSDRPRKKSHNSRRSGRRSGGRRDRRILSTEAEEQSGKDKDEKEHQQETVASTTTEFGRSFLPSNSRQLRNRRADGGRAKGS